MSSVLLLAANWKGDQQQRARMEAFRGDVADMARISENIIADRLREYDHTLLVLREAYVADPKHLAEHVRLLRSGPLADRELLVVLVDREGGLAYTDTPQVKAGLYLGDRKYFRYFADGGKDRLYIDEPSFGRVTRRYILPLARPIYDRQGGFLGVLAISVKQDSLGKFGSNQQLSEDTTITVVNRNGAVISRSRDFDKVQGTKLPRELLAPMLKGTAGIFQGRAVPGHVERIIAYRRVDEATTQLIAYAEASPQGVLREMSQQRAVLMGTAAFTSFVIMVLIAVYLKGRTTAEQLIRSLRESKEQEYRTLTGTTLDGFCITDKSGRVLDANDTFGKILGYAREELLTLSIIDIEASETREQIAAHVRSVMEVGSRRFQSKWRRKDGVIIEVEISAQFVNDSKGRFFVFVRDITESKLAEEQVKNMSQRFFLATSAAHLGVWDWNVRDNKLIWDDRMFELYGIARESFSANVDAWISGLHPEDREAVLAQSQAALKGERKFDAVFRVLHPDGTVRHIKADALVIRGADGAAERMIGINADITEHMEAEEVLHASEERFRTLVNTIPDMIWLKDADGVYLSCNAIFERFFGAKEADIVGKTDYDFVDKEQADLYRELDRKAMAAGKSSSNEEAIVFRADGQQALLYNTKTPMYDGEGNLIGVLGVGRDISEIKHNEEQRMRLEGQLQQIQKIESVGRLAGGVAHDFNNMLSVILGHTSLALLETEPSQELWANLEEIRKAAERSADLTRQLLAFARKQTISPRVLNLNETVSGMFKMLQRLIGEEVTLVWQPAAELWPVKVDPSQIDQVLANLCVNARDSISGNGRIIIETKNVVVDENYSAQNADARPGEYVSLSASDDGCGMDQETLALIFEPFFTTKGVGEGTGLGLSTVFGAVKQNGGFINVYSEVGKGTSFSIYLPRIEGNGATPRMEEMAPPVPRGVETILLVEDEPAILNMVAMILGRQGYTVLKADTPAEAVRLTREHAAEISLLITDVIMPEMNGKDLAVTLRALSPQLRCLFMSGYTADAIAQHGVLEDGVNFIQKPFSLPAVAAKVREVLDKG